MKFQLFKLFIFLSVLFSNQATWASCARTSYLSATDSNTAKIPAGNINLPATMFVPNGSLIKTIVVPPTNYTYSGSTASTVLWTCDYTDLSSLYFLVATNGDDRVGGFWNVGNSDGLSDVYATDLAYVGMKVSFDDVTVTRYYKKVPIKTYLLSNGKINIRLQDLPTALVELYRVSDLPPANGAVSNYCGGNFIYASSTGTMQTCKQPNFYIQLVGNGITHDDIGEDSAHHFDFWGANNGFGYGMNNVTRLYNVQTCAATSATPYVMFPTITTRELANGKTVSQTFSVSLNCFLKVNSGTADKQTALGFQVSSGAYNAAKALGLTNSYYGVTTLLSDNYNDPGIAKGVGIDIAYAATPTIPMTLLSGQSPLNPFDTNYRGAKSGWYPVLDHATQTGGVGVYSTYMTNFVATLRKLNGQTVSAGKVHSTVTVQVRMQ